MVDADNSRLLDILQQIGALQHAIGVIQAQNAHIIKEQDQAAERRQRMYEKLDQIEPIRRELEQIVPLVKEHEQARQRGIGMAWLARSAWTIGGGSAGAAALWVLQKLFGSPPHP